MRKEFFGIAAAGALALSGAQAEERKGMSPECRQAIVNYSSAKQNYERACKVGEGYGGYLEGDRCSSLEKIKDDLLQKSDEICKKK